MTTKSPIDKDLAQIISNGNGFYEPKEVGVGNNHYENERQRQQHQLQHESDESGISVEVSCSPSFDGGLPQTFVLEIRHALSQKVVTQKVQPKPHFRITHLPPETKLSLHLYAFNAKGNSTAVGLETITGNNPIHQTQDVKYSFSAG